MEGLPLSEIPSTPMSCADLQQYQFPFPAETESMPSQQMGDMASTSATPPQVMGGMANAVSSRLQQGSQWTANTWAWGSMEDPEDPEPFRCPQSDDEDGRQQVLRSCQRVLKELRPRLHLHQQLPSASSIDAMLYGKFHIQPIDQKKKGGSGELSVLVGGLWHEVFPKFYQCTLWDEGHSIERKVCVYGKSARNGGVHCRAFLTCPGPPKCRRHHHCPEVHLLSLARQFLRTTYSLPAEASVPKPVGLQVLATDEMPEVNAPLHREQMDQHVEAEDHTSMLRPVRHEIRAPWDRLKVPVSEGAGL